MYRELCSLGRKKMATEIEFLDENLAIVVGYDEETETYYGLVPAAEIPAVHPADLPYKEWKEVMNEERRRFDLISVNEHAKVRKDGFVHIETEGFRGRKVDHKFTPQQYKKTLELLQAVDEARTIQNLEGDSFFSVRMAAPLARDRAALEAAVGGRF